MGWLKNRRRASSVTIDSVCDTCNTDLQITDGYHLATRDVVLSESYWRKHLQLVKTVQDTFKMDERQRLEVFTGLMEHAAGQGTPWSICENCTELFIFDRDKARSCAMRGVPPDGCGRVDIAGFALFTAAAWEHVTGRWPANVEQPEVSDSCDLCAKKIYFGEFTGVVPRARMDHFHAVGIVDGYPVTAPRPDRDAWVACHPCMSRLLARAHRAEHGLV